MQKEKNHLISKKLKCKKRDICKQLTKFFINSESCLVTTENLIKAAPISDSLSLFIALEPSRSSALER